MPGLTVPRTVFKGATEHNFERLCCVKCNLLLNDPLPACGHRLCKYCADDIILEEKTPRCPECDEVFDDEDGANYFPDRFVKREILIMQVICVYSKAGCYWEGNIGEFEKHIKKCDFATSSCEYCHENVRRDQLELHLQLCPSIPKPPNLDEIATISKLIRSKSTELEDYDFRLSLVENSNYHDGTVIPAELHRIVGMGNTHPVFIMVMNGISIPVEFSHGDKLWRQLLKERLRAFLWQQKALGQEKSLERNTSSPLHVRWLQFQNLLLLPYGNVKSVKCYLHVLPNDPVQPACGHRLCKSCANNLIKEAKTPRCPECNEVLDEEELGPKYFSDRFLEFSHDDKLRHQLLKERLREFLWRQKALRQEKSLERNTSSPLDVRWLEFQSLLLLVYGDVERNPGPMTRDELEIITNSVLSEDDYFDVFTSVNTLCAKWHDFCLALGLPPSLLSSIRKDHNGDSSGCLREGLISWLQQHYKKEKYGLPSWRRLVEAVDHPAGGCNHTLALKIAEEHKLLPAKEGSVAAPIPAAVCSDPKKSQAMSTAFANMYRAISRLLQRSVQVDDLEEFLRCFCHPQSPRQLCVDPRVYEGATSTKDILKKLCPEFINPAELFILEGIVETFGSRQCKKLLRDFQDKFY